MKNKKMMAKNIQLKETNTFEKINDNIYLCLGDSLEKLKEIEDCSVDCVITDPPYFIDGMGNNWNVKELNKKASKAKTIGGLPVGMKFDPKQGIELQNFIEKISQEVFRILRPGGFYLSFSQARLLHRMAIGIENCGFEIRDTLFWKRRSQPKAFSQNHFVKKMNIPEDEKERIINSMKNRKTPQLNQELESIVLAQKPKEGTFVENWVKYEVGLVDTSETLDGLFPSTVMEVERDKHKEFKHFTVKPVVLMEHLIKLFSTEGSVICDPFLGSGSTGVACINTNRKFIGIELDENYFDVSKIRILEKIKEIE